MEPLRLGGIVDELVELQARAGPERQLGVVVELNLTQRIGADFDVLVLMNLIAALQRARIAVPAPPSRD